MIFGDLMKTLICLTTYGAAAYIDLSLAMYRRFGADVIVCDDGSGSHDLQMVCKKYNVPLFGCCKTRETVPGFGDMIGTVEGIRYGAAMGYDLVIKQSRRWITLVDPRRSLEHLAEMSEGATFSNITKSFNFGFRTEFTGYRISAWLDMLPVIGDQIQSGKEVFVEGYIHKLARKVEPDTARYHSFIRHRSKGYAEDQKGYVHWEWMGNDRRQVPEYIMWHDTHSPEDYHAKAQELGLKWSINDFKEFNR